MNLEQNLQKRFESYCAENNIMFYYDKDRTKMINTDNIDEAESIVTVNPYRTIKLPKSKLITLDWIIDKLNKESTFKNLSKYLRDLLDSNMNCYPTSYGIGIFCLFSRKGDVSKVESFLNNNNIEYRNEYSEAHWVYRFVISKNMQNIQRLTNINTINQ